MAATGGVCVWLTGRSGAGKSTVTAALVPMLEASGRTVTVLDVVPLLAKAPGERSSAPKLLRKAFVAGEIARHGGIAIAVTVSARAEVRAACRQVVGADRFIEVHADIPPDTSRSRRAARTRKPPLVKRLRRARRGVRARATSAVTYEAPTDPDLKLDTLNVAPEVNARAVVDLLVARGFIEPVAVR
jgi:sulfate adenylyltransferase